MAGRGLCRTSIDRSTSASLTFEMISFDPDVLSVKGPAILTQEGVTAERIRKNACRG